MLFPQKESNFKICYTVVCTCLQRNGIQKHRNIGSKKLKRMKPYCIYLMDENKSPFVTKY